MYDHKKLCDIWKFKGDIIKSVKSTKTGINIKFGEPLHPGWNKRIKIHFDDSTDNTDTTNDTTNEKLPDPPEEEITEYLADMFAEEISTVFECVI